MDLYLAEIPKVVMGSKFPIGVLGDIKLYFMRYYTHEEVLAKWEERKKRMNREIIIVIMVERNGFDDNDFDYVSFLTMVRFSKFLMFSAKIKYKNQE